MAASLSAKAILSFLGTYTNALDISTPKDIINKSYESSLTSGTSASQGDRQFSDTRSVAASSNDDIDLAAIVDGLGFTGQAKIRMLFIKNNSTVQTLTVSGSGPSNYWLGPLGSTITIGPSGILFIFDGTGFTVDSTHKVLRIANAAGATATFDIILWGASA